MNEYHKGLVAEVSDNTAKIVWPQDNWGITSGLKKELIKAISNIRGVEFKKELVEATLYIALAHMKKRDAKDKAFQKKRQDQIKQAALARIPMERIQAGVTVNKESANAAS